MAITRDAMHPIVYVMPNVQANRWEITWFRVDNPPQGPVMKVGVGVVAMRRSSDGTDSGRLDLPDMSYSGDRLVAIMADAAAKVQAALVASIPPPLAYYEGTRDALYAALLQDGVIPA